ncbi:MAG: hypothetical protein JST28_09640 [Acidobacteria bacterium]|nr:hypothetical protein [Acidobacteriota bacterium]
MKMRKLDESVFLNVDLEIFSQTDLKPLADALKKSLTVHFLGIEFGKQKAYFALATQPKTPDEAIIRYCKLVQTLPSSKRKIWDDAESRSFDIGFESPKRGRYFWGAVTSEAIRAASAVGAQIAITVYGPMKIVNAPNKPRRKATS